MRFLQTAEAAAQAGVTPDAIRQAVRNGRLEVAHTTGRGLQLFTHGAVDHYIAGRASRLAARAAGAKHYRRRTIRRSAK